MTDNIIKFPTKENFVENNEEENPPIILLYKKNLIEVLKKWPDDAVFALREISHIPKIVVNSLDYETDRLGLKIGFINKYKNPLLEDEQIYRSDNLEQDIPNIHDK